MANQSNHPNRVWINDGRDASTTAAKSWVAITRWMSLWEMSTATETWTRLR